MNTADFFQTLFSVYPPNADLTIEIRPLLPEWRKEQISEEEIRAVHSSVRRWYAIAPVYLSKAAKYAEGYADTFDCYYGVLPRVGRSGSQRDVWGASCLFCDVDGGEEGVEGAKIRIKESDLPLPHIAVRSGGGIHCYWLLSEPVTFENHSQRETYKSVLRRLCRKIGGKSPAAHADFSACECARILRPPNTINHKRENEPRTVKTVRSPKIQDGSSNTVLHSNTTSLLNDALSYGDWYDLLPREPREDLPRERHAPTPAYTPDGFLYDGIKRWAQEGYPEGRRHLDLTGAAAWLVRDCKVSKETALELLWQKAQRSGGRRTITRREIEAMIRWA